MSLPNCTEAPTTPLPPVPAENQQAQSILSRFRRHAPLNRAELAAVVALLESLNQHHGPTVRGSQPYTALLRILKAHCFPAPNRITFNQMQGLRCNFELLPYFESKQSYQKMFCER